MRGPPSRLKQPAAVDRGASWWRSTMRPRLERPIIFVLVWAALGPGWWGASLRRLGASVGLARGRVGVIDALGSVLLLYSRERGEAQFASLAR